MKMRETAAATATQKPPRAKPGGGYDDADDHIDDYSDGPHSDSLYCSEFVFASSASIPQRTSRMPHTINELARIRGLRLD